jgi:hypothetical protein
MRTDGAPVDELLGSSLLEENPRRAAARPLIRAEGPQKLLTLSSLDNNMEAAVH